MRKVKMQSLGNRKTSHPFFIAAILKVLTIGYFTTKTINPLDSVLKTARIWPLNKNLYRRMPSTWTSQTEEESHPFYTWKVLNNLIQTTRLSTKHSIPTLQKRRFKEDGFLRFCSVRAPEEATSSQTRAPSQPALSLSLDFKQPCVLSDLLPEQLFSFYCSPRTFL